jgi:long-chain acyl-CoA synthetase
MLVLTPKEAGTRSAAAAGALVSRGCRPGDRVAIVTPEHSPGSSVAAGQAAAICTVLGALRMGVVPVMVNGLLTQRERAYIATDSQSSLMIEDPEELIALADRPGPSPDLADHPLGRPMHYTSGTTGRPKGVYADLTEDQSRRLWLDEQEHWGHNRDDLTLVHSPLCHSAPLRFALATICAGGSVALAGRFDASRIAAAISELQPTTAFVVPSHLQALLALPGGPPPSPYRLLAHAGSACPPPVKDSTHAWAGADKVWEFYGSTEGQFTSCRGTEWEQHPGTVGRARAGRSILVDDAGLIWCEAPDYARFEYWQAPDKTAGAWRNTASGRAFTVGDVGELHDGYLCLTGRREDLIISGGVNVYPAEVEATIAEHPGIRDVAVYASPNERWGHMVCAAYVGDVSEAELREWIASRLASYKRPKTWVRLSVIPRNTMGKVRHEDLPAQAD